MKKSEAKPGTKVIACLINNYDSDYPKIVKYFYSDTGEVMEGTILDKKLSTPNKVVVDWDDGHIEKVDISILSLSSDQKKLDKEFETYNKDIRLKIKSLAKSLKELSIDAKKHGLPNLNHIDYDIARILTDTLNDCGWISSTRQC